jgi:hypothetical protein
MPFAIEEKKSPALRGFFYSIAALAYSPNALATNGGDTSTPVCSGAV